MLNRTPESIQSDLRALMTICVARAAIDDVKQRLIPAGNLLIELEASGDVHARGGWIKYAESGELETTTGIAGRCKATVYSYLTLALYGYEKFQAALIRSNTEGKKFDRQSGLDWACEIVRWAQGKIAKTRTRVAVISQESREKLLLRKVSLLEGQRDRLFNEHRKAVQAGGWSDLLLNEISREMEFDSDLAMSSAAAELSANRDSYATPWPIFNALNREFNFTLDCCADAQNTKLPTFLADPHGLTTEYPPNTIAWMNPPYSNPLPWMAKAFTEATRGSTVACLVPVDGGTRWWNNYVMRASEIRWRPERIQYLGADHKAIYGSVLVIFRPGHEGFPVITGWRDETGNV